MSNISRNSRIQHFKICNAPTDLVEHLQDNLLLKPEHIAALLDLGSIYLNGNRIKQNIILKQGDYIRVHIEPRRFSIPETINNLILFEDDWFIALNKPSGIPCHPTLDNSHENLLNLLSLERNREYSLCHRLDIGTQGVLLFAKSKLIQTEMMRQWKDVQKIYHAQTIGPQLRPMLLKHWMQPHPRAPKTVTNTPTENWHLCELQILNSETPNGSKFQNHNLYTIKLLTGRTHQIRAQLSYEKNPIIGDIMYGFLSQNDSNIDCFALKCTEISFCFKDKNYLILTS